MKAWLVRDGGWKATDAQEVSELAQKVLERRSLGKEALTRGKISWKFGEKKLLNHLGIIKNLEGTTKETAKTRQEIDVGIFQLPTLQSVIGKEMKDEKGQSVRVEKTPDNKYYLESL